MAFAIQKTAPFMQFAAERASHVTLEQLQARGFNWVHILDRLCNSRCILIIIIINPSSLMKNVLKLDITKTRRCKTKLSALRLKCDHVTSTILFWPRPPAFDLSISPMDPVTKMATD